MSITVVPTTTSIDNIGELHRRKVELVSGCLGAKSLRDFGGLYLVHGKYLLEPAVALGARFASMVDVTPRVEFEVEIAKARQQIPNLEVEFVNRDFRESQTWDNLRPVDVSILFEVLLHQENYVEVLRNAVKRTDQYICIAQPVLKEEEFPFPAAAVLLQFWEETLKREYREGTFWPEEPPCERFTPSCWMWGQTTSHFVHLMHGFGWDCDFCENAAGVSGKHWDFALLRFRKRA